MAAEPEDIDGAILSIVVENILCHDRYEIELNRNINFVVGSNGSGKSALITALVVGLGGTASITSRGARLSDIIKRGAASASVEIKIKNSSPAAYKHSVFGNSITVIHNFSPTSSSYKVKSHTGEVKSTKFKDVREILAHHNIQVDNPISVLNQEEAKSFLRRNDKELYTFFRKATNFDDTENNYKKTLELCERAKSVWNRKYEASKVYEEKYNEWKAIYELMKSQSELEEQEKRLQNEYYWCEVQELEAAAAEAERLLRRRTEDCAKLQAELDALAAADDETLAAARSELERATGERRALEARLEERRAAQRGAAAAARAAGAAADRARDRRARERDKCETLRTEIQTIQQDAGGAGAAAAAARAAAAERAAREAGARRRTQEHAAEQARAHDARERDQLEDATARLRACEKEHEKVRGQLAALRARQRAGGGARASFGPLMERLCERVAAARGSFSQPPRGPVGAYLSLVDNKWGSALEHIIGHKSLKTFCVNNAQDSRKLFEIIKEVFTEDMPGVATSRFLPAAHDVSAAAARAAGHVTALDALRVSDPVVANFLIDNFALEAVVLVPDQQTAMRLTDREERVPRGLQRVVTQQCAEYYPAPNYRSYGGRARPVSFLHQDLAGRIQAVQAEEEAAARAVEAAHAHLEACSRAARAADARLRDEERALRALRDAARAADAELRAATDALAAYQAPTEHALEEELKISEERLKQLEAEVSQSEEGRQESEKRQVELDREVAALEENLRQVKQACRNFSERAQSEQLRGERARAAGAALRQRLAALAADARRAADHHRAADAAAKEKARDAEKLCPRIRTTRSVAAVEEQLRGVWRERRRRGVALAPELVTERLCEAKRRHTTARKALAKVERLIKEIDTTAQVHLNKCLKMQTDIVREIETSFASIQMMRTSSGERGERGQLHVDLAQGAVRMVARGHMSGGEHSFATVAFLMALWECIELPFFFLDEFDVFMDRVSRSQAIALLLTHAKKKASNRQFVFFMPQEGLRVQRDANVSIFRLSAPRP